MGPTLVSQGPDDPEIVIPAINTAPAVTVGVISQGPDKGEIVQTPPTPINTVSAVRGGFVSQGPGAQAGLISKP